MAKSLEIQNSKVTNSFSFFSAFLNSQYSLFLDLDLKCLNLRQNWFYNNFVVALLVQIEVVLPQIVFWAILNFAQNECTLRQSTEHVIKKELKEIYSTL